MATTFSNFLLIVLLTLVSLLGSKIVYARFISSKHEAVAKTINDEGIIIDCIDIDNQSVFRYPPLRNHTKQMNPVSNLVIRQSQAMESRGPLVQSWTKYGECPEGTVPISRTRTNINLPRAVPPMKTNELTDDHETAQGGILWVTCINECVESMSRKWEASSSKIWVMAGENDNLNSIEAGWMTNGHNKMGCYNHECPGFIQVNCNVVPGAPLEPMSVYNGDQYEVSITIYKEYSTGNCWVKWGVDQVGYFPPPLFSILTTQPADVLSWGGGVYNLNWHLGQHTTKQMGSGHSTLEGFKKASSFIQLRYLDESGIIFNPKSFEEMVTNPTCYES